MTYSKKAWFEPSLKETKEESESKTCCMDTTRVEIQLNFCHRCLPGPRRCEGSFCQTVEMTTNHGGGNAPVNTPLRSITAPGPISSAAPGTTCTKTPPVVTGRLVQIHFASFRPRKLFLPLSIPPTRWGFDNAVDSGLSRLLSPPHLVSFAFSICILPPWEAKKKSPRVPASSPNNSIT